MLQHGIPKVRLLFVILTILISSRLFAEDGYEAWLRYRPIEDKSLLNEYRGAAVCLNVQGDTPILKSAQKELCRGLAGLLGHEIGQSTGTTTGNGTIILGTAATLGSISGSVGKSELKQLGPDGYIIRPVLIGGHQELVIAGQTDRGTLYGVYQFLRLMQTHVPVNKWTRKETPANPLRLVNHWDNLNGTVERGYAGDSIFYWDQLPKLDPRYEDYARLLASIGINGCVVNNVNTAKDGLQGWRLLTTPWLPKLKALAGAMRPYGIRLYISVSFTSPVIIDKFKTADPLDPAVNKWWADKADEIYREIPDFGGFLVKADSEGEGGPLEYGRNHADGANMLAKALKPHQGTVIWRAFVYDVKNANDRAKQAYLNFKPLDGLLQDNVILQSKNGPMDFQVREPVSPVFSAMGKSNLMLELQITQEYTGHVTDLCYLVPQWKEYLEFDTYAKGEGSTLKKIVSGALDGRKSAGIAGVSNVGSDRNWTGHPLAQANLYGFGRLAWNPDLSSTAITEEWVQMAFGNDPTVVRTISEMLLNSWRTYENYTSPLGAGFMCREGDHFNPDPAKRAQKYHHSDTKGVGFDRTGQTGDGYAREYPQAVASRFESLATCPEDYLLFFHHLPYTYRLKSGKTLIQHIYDTHFDGVEQVKQMVDSWKTLEGRIDQERYQNVLDRLKMQIAHAELWRDAINTYYFQLSGIPDAKHRLDPALISEAVPIQ